MIRRIEEPARFLEAVGSQNHLPAEVGVPVGHVGNPGVSVSGLIGANRRRNGKAAPRAEDAVPLPAADQFLHPAAGTAPKSLGASDRQIIAGTLVAASIPVVRRTTNGKYLVVEAKKFCERNSSVLTLFRKNGFEPIHSAKRAAGLPLVIAHV
jgi:hypothetical protein